MKERRFSIEKLRFKLSKDKYKPYYFMRDFEYDMVMFQKHLIKLYDLDLTIEECYKIWEKFSQSWDAQFLDYNDNKVNSALEEYMLAK